MPTRPVKDPVSQRTGPRLRLVFPVLWLCEAAGSGPASKPRFHADPLGTIQGLRSGSRRPRGCVVCLDFEAWDGGVRWEMWIDKEGDRTD